MQVLIIGGGDGGVVREVIKHPQVERVSLCEIDEVGCIMNEASIVSLCITNQIESYRSLSKIPTENDRKFE